MSYILKNDFSRVIVLTQLDEITVGDDDIINLAEVSAVEEAAGYMRHRYDTNKEFRSIVQHDAAISYEEGARVFALVAEKPVMYIAKRDVSIGALITSTADWEQRDDRNQKVIVSVIIGTLYELYTRLHGSDIPNWLAVRYDGNSSLQTGGIIGYYKNVQKGRIQADIPLLPDVADGTDKSGNRIAYGVATAAKRNNTAI